MRWTNRFLESLEPADMAVIQPHLSRAQFTRGEVVASSDEELSHAILPINSILSVITVMRGGASIESRTIGIESGFGLLHALGSRFSFDRVEVQVGGDAWQIGLAELDRAASESATMLHAIARFAQATLVQAAQSTACIALHAALPRLCRWLLMTRDRLDSDVLPLTQEHLGIMLGLQRTTVTTLAQDLQSQGVIDYSRGRIRILDGARLHQQSCECYDRVEEAIRRILPVQIGTPGQQSG